VKSESDQTSGFEKESTRFVKSHLGEYPSAPDWVLHSPELRNRPVTSVLDVGCGPGNHLRSLVDGFDSTRGVGLEPSAEATTMLRSHYSADPRLEFITGFAHKLPFQNESFDVVVCWSVLHWVGRNEYLQTLGELIRVTRSHLIVMDYVGSEDYRVTYGHDDRFFTYKMDFVPAILASGVMELQVEKRWVTEPDGADRLIGVGELDPFLKNPLSYHARRGCIFRKDFDVLPVFSSADFGL